MIFKDMYYYMGEGEGQKLKFPAEILKLLHSYRQDAEEKTEAGGIIVGKITYPDENYVVKTITEPLENDIRTRYTFFRDDKLHQETFDNLYKNDELLTYIGEWHTHPENYPLPSITDINNWKKLLREVDLDGDYMIFIIVGIQEMRVWIGDKRDISIKLL